MSKWVVRVVALAMVGVVIFGAVGFAAAQGPGGEKPGRARGSFDGALIGRWQPGDHVIGQLIAEAADATGMTPQELIAAVRDSDGQTLAEVLSANGVDPQQISDAVKAKATASINDAVAAGTLDEVQAENAISHLEETLDTAMNSELPLGNTVFSDRVGDRMSNTFENTLISVLSEMAGVDVQDVLRDTITPPTLAEIADSYGLDADAIIAETEARVTEEVNAKVADGTLDEAQGAAILEGLHDRLVERFNNPLQLGPLGERIGTWGQRDSLGA